MLDRPVDKRIVLCGEVGLTGEVRSVNRIEHRMSEAISLGFEIALVPALSMSKNLDTAKLNIKVNPIKNVKDAFKLLF